MNVFDVELQFDEGDPPGYHTAYVRTAPLLGGEKIAFNVFELPPGQSVCPYHYEGTEEEWIVVLTGRPTVRTPAGEQELGPWDCVFCPPGEEGAHKVTNRGEEPARIVIWPSTPTRRRSAPGRRGSSSVSATPSTTSTASSPEARVESLAGPPAELVSDHLDLRTPSVVGPVCRVDRPADQLGDGDARAVGLTVEEAVLLVRQDDLEPATHQT